VDELFDEADDQGNRDGLVTTGRHDVELVGTTQEGVEVQGCLARGGPSGLGANAGEQSGRRRPDARSFAFFGGEHATKQRDRRVMLAVSFGEFVHDVIATSFVDA
jgi:hypothetical protein